MSTLTAPSGRRTGVFLTQFPGTSLTGFDGKPVDWSDHQAAHRAVMRLFTPGLPGGTDRRRDESGILYRVDVAHNGDGEPEQTVLVQSLVCPEVVPTTARSVEVSDAAWTPSLGEQVVFRLAVNPVRRSKRYFTDRAKTRPAEPGVRTAHSKQVASAVHPDDILDWLAPRLNGALSDVSLISHTRDESRTRRGHANLDGTEAKRTSSHLIIVDTIDAVAVVSDPAALDLLRREGVGRSKAYGCGLLTIKRIG